MIKKEIRLKYNENELIPEINQPYVIGRDIDNDIVSSLATVSRRHASIIFDGQHCIIEDLNSKNGTMVNNQKISRYILEHDDIIKIGDLKIEIEISEADTDLPIDETSPLSDDSLVLEKKFHKIMGQAQDDSRLIRHLVDIKKMIDINRVKLKNVASIDALTGLYNRGYFDQAFEKEILRDARYGHPLSILLLDIDYFKKINDAYGHEQGDRVLKEVAATLKNMVRQTDIVARYGGEEYVLMLMETEAIAAYKVAEKIRNQIENKSIEFSPQKFTVSIGIACYPSNGLTAKIMLKAADMALYQSKNNGRNRSTISDWKA